MSLQRWNGTAWVTLSPKRWDGLAWVSTPIARRWDGTTWVDLLPARPVSDSFNRTVTNGWGIADTGQDWVLTGGNPSDYSVKGV